MKEEARRTLVTITPEAVQWLLKHYDELADEAETYGINVERYCYRIGWKWQVVDLLTALLAIVSPALMIHLWLMSGRSCQNLFDVIFLAYMAVAYWLLTYVFLDAIVWILAHERGWRLPYKPTKAAEHLLAHIQSLEVLLELQERQEAGAESGAEE